MTSMRHKFSDQIRRAIDGSELSRYALCNSIGLNQGTMSRFMAGKGNLSIATLDRLAELLGIEIVVKRPTRKGN
jgi:transcriptional regulator with XRE-family HTH domain